MTDNKLPVDDTVTHGDQAVDKALAGVAEKFGESNPELALKPDTPKQNYIKMAVDYGPLIAFGLTFLVWKVLKLTPQKDALIWASGVLGAASLLALIAGLIAEKRIAWIPLVSCVITIPMTILTVLTHDPVFVKIKMTIVDVLIGGILLGALLMKKEPLKLLLGDALKLKDAAWPRLTLYYALFYFAMAAINEGVWRTQSDSVWMIWKMGSMVGGPILLSICLLPFMMKNMITEPETAGH
ncbi:MAG: septation protein IspZ [Asticcacaulis sp.]|uniref:inner membrane-spanning protein YciB n=1 Tax=Asticcacaulis sp. TaxID=1872648 RepID=UPI0039E50A9B